VLDGYIISLNQKPKPSNIPHSFFVNKKTEKLHFFGKDGILAPEIVDNPITRQQKRGN
jgi:hypothetical protein